MGTRDRTVSPWLFVPVLYFLQAVPVALVQDTATILFKSLGEANEPIARWTSIVALPWALQFLLGPVVDLTSTRRRWVTNTQLGLTASLLALPFALRLPNAFALSLGVLFLTAVLSVLGNVAQDGLYLLLLDKPAQARFAGVQTTSFRLGTLFAKGLVVWAAGLLMAGPAMTVNASGGELTFAPAKDRVVSATTARLSVQGSALAGERDSTDAQGHTYVEKLGDVVPPIKVPPDVRVVRVEPDGRVLGDGRELGRLSAPVAVAAESAARVSREQGWFIALLGAGAIFGIGALLNRRTLPRPVDDEAKVGDAGPEVLRTLAILGTALSGYFAVNGAVRLAAHVASGFNPEGLKGWRLPEVSSVLGRPFEGVPSPVVEGVQLLVCGGLAFALWTFARRSMRGTAMEEAFGSYFRQPGIASILFFLMFYRFGEAMVAKMSPLFLSDDLAKGGMALNPALVGTIKGVVGVFGIVLGGIAGGLFISRKGLWRAFPVIAVCMHLPILLYLWAAVVRPPTVWLYGVDFVDQFGYGFGFAGYLIFQMRVAQRGRFRTAHYAMGVGIGAMFISVAGILSGKIQVAVGWPGFFLAAVFMAVPGLLAIRLIPRDVAEG